MAARADTGPTAGADEQRAALPPVLAMNGSAEADWNSTKTRKEECVHVGGKSIDVEGVGTNSGDGARSRSWWGVGSPELRASG